MRHTVPVVVLLFFAACGTPAHRQETPAEAPDPVLVKLRDGESPDTLRYDKNPVWLAEIGKALAEDRAWKTDADAFAAIAHFAANAGTEQIPIIESLLTDAKPERRMRGILITRLSTSAETLELLEKHAAVLLDPADPQVAGVAVGAMGFRRAKGATEAILGYYEARDDSAALRALGRIWEGVKDDPLRTAVLVVAHARAMSPASAEGLTGEEATGAMLRIMTDEELGEFITKWVPESFGSRQHVIKVAGAKDFNSARGRRIHEAFLKSPDPALVTIILWRSPHKIDAAAVTPLLDDERVTESGAKVCDYAAARLESIETGLAPELPADEGLRERRLKKWKARR
jgi:hypothetical protein